MLDPGDHRTSGVVKQVRAVLKALPAHRIVLPDIDTLAKAALLAGLLCRLQGYAEDRRREALSDSVLFLQAQNHGLVVLTRNIVDFDTMLQLQPRSGALFYRQR